MSQFWASEGARKERDVLNESSSLSDSAFYISDPTTTNATSTAITATTADVQANDDDDDDDDLDDFEIETFDVAPPDSALLNSSAITSNKLPPPLSTPQAMRPQSSMPVDSASYAVPFGAQLFSPLPPVKKPRKPRAPKDPNAPPKPPKVPKAPKVPKEPKVPKLPKVPKPRKDAAIKASFATTVVKQEVGDFAVGMPPPPFSVPPPLIYDPVMPPARRKVGRPRKVVGGSVSAPTAMFSFPKPVSALTIPRSRVSFLSRRPIFAPPADAPLSGAPVFVPKPEPTTTSFVAPEPVVGATPEPIARSTNSSVSTAATTSATSTTARKRRRPRKVDENAEWTDGVELSSDVEFDSNNAPKGKAMPVKLRRRKRHAKPLYKPSWSDLAMPERRELSAESRRAAAQCFPAPPLEPGDAERLAAADEYYNALLAPPALRPDVPAGLPANVMLSRVQSTLIGKPFLRSTMHVAAAYHAYRGKRTRLVERIGRVRSYITFTGDTATTEIESLLPAPQLHDTPNGIGGGIERVAHAVNMLTCMSADPTSPAHVLRESRHLYALKVRCAEERTATLAAMSAAHWTNAAAIAATPSRPVTLLDSDIVLPILRPVDRYRFAAAQHATNMGAVMAFNNRAEASAQIQAVAIDDIASQMASSVQQQKEERVVGDAPLEPEVVAAVKTMPEPNLDVLEPAMPEPEVEF
jgi:hypothetical protein